MAWAGEAAGWRQGDLLTQAAAVALTGDNDPQCAVVVISHSCDIARTAEREPAVEIVVGRFIEVANGNRTHAKNPRCLDLTMTAGVEPCIVSLEITNRASVRKESIDGGAAATALEGYAPNFTYRCSIEELKILQNWLASRYKRSGFPGEFERRFGDITGLDERIKRILRRHGEHIAIVFFELDSGEALEHLGGENDPYALEITLVYSVSEDPEAALTAATAASDEIRQAFIDRCRPDGEWRNIELVDIAVYSTAVFSIARATQLQRWNTGDYISLHDSGPQAEADV